MADKNIRLFENKRVRTAWNEDKQDWYFSIVDIVSILTEQPTHDGARKYWSVLKTRLKQEGGELTTICSQLKMQSADGKFYNTDVADTRGILRIIQSIPSPKAEPFKQWLAKVGAERIDETIDPEMAIDRAFATYLRKGYTKEWINQRILTLRVRNELVTEWDNRGVREGQEYAILTDEISKAWSGMTTRQYKNFKGLKKENLRDNMTTLELVLNMLAEVTTTEISKKEKPHTFEENKAVARSGGEVAGEARRAVEKRTGKPVITSKKAVDFAQLFTDVIVDKAEEKPTHQKMLDKKKDTVTGNGV
ncbi:MAG: Bro-N domain-containing protein [Candidatus Bathyarchaeota archaeon]|nr:Bro-N domain-containing protein [Candidatus Termiticorpusculum sp.]